MPIPRKRGRPPHGDLLTPAEWRTVEFVRHGLTNAEIARRSEISIDAVKYHVANALQKLGLSGRAKLRAWPGVRRDSALHEKERTMDEPLLQGKIGQIARTVADVAISTRWYADVLGLRHLYSFGSLVFFDCDGVRLFLSQAEAVKPESILYFRVGDIRTSHDALASRGVVFTHAPHMIHRHADGTEEWMAFFSDPEGRPLAIMSQVMPASGS
jgi:DNA-binding CsgD family transcriptional regulator/catechol 2,3-dioxygenase-like lactoylglutathione lyase family enzyme